MRLPGFPQTDAGASSPVCRQGSSPISRTELIFGSERKDLPPVTDAEWQSFVDDENRATVSRQAEIEALRSFYEKRFGQDSVARIDGLDCVGF
jgi:hypothetical protein